MLQQLIANQSFSFSYKLKRLMNGSISQQDNATITSSQSFNEDEVQSIHNQQSGQKVNTNLKNLQQKISYSNAQLLELTFNDQKFTSTIRQYNHQAVQNMKVEDYERALVYLQEAQKILEYAASCGKTIDRFLIVFTLHNQASAYQKMWQLEKSADYMEAIIYNMKTYLQNCYPINIYQQMQNDQQQTKKQFSSQIYRRMMLAIYSLQYSAVNSQIGRHQIAIRSVKNALNCLQKNLTQLYAFQCFKLHKKAKNSEIKILKNICQGIHKKQIHDMIPKIRSNLKILKSKSLLPKKQFLWKLCKFSIGEVMQIQPKILQKIIHVMTIQQLISPQGIINSALYISICYYAIATQMRLANARNSILTPAQKTTQFQKSKIFHLYAIKITVQHVPCITEYLQHILKSFKNNYHIDLNIDQAQQKVQHAIQNVKSEKKQRQQIIWEVLNNQSFGIREDSSISSINDENSNDDDQQKKLPINSVKLNNLLPERFDDVNDFGFPERKKIKPNKKLKRRKLSRNQSIESKNSNLNSAKKSKQKIRTLSNSTNLKIQTSNKQSNPFTFKGCNKKKKYSIHMKTTEIFAHNTQNLKIQSNEPLSSIQIDKKIKKTKKTKKTLKNRRSCSKNKISADFQSNNCNSTEHTKDQTKKLTDNDKGRQKIVSQYLNDHEPYHSTIQKQKKGKQKKLSECQQNKGKKNKNREIQSKSKRKLIEGVKSPIHKKQHMLKHQKVSKFTCK